MFGNQLCCLFHTYHQYYGNYILWIVSYPYISKQLTPYLRQNMLILTNDIVTLTCTFVWCIFRWFNHSQNHGHPRLRGNLYRSVWLQQNLFQGQIWWQVRLHSPLWDTGRRHKQDIWGLIMMASWYGHAFRIIGPLWWESTGDRWIPITKGHWCGSFIFHISLTNCWINTRLTGDLRCHDGNVATLMV